MIMGASGKGGPLQPLWKQLLELNPSLGKSSSVVQWGAAEQPHCGDVSGAQCSNTSPSKQDLLAPVNFAVG